MSKVASNGGGQSSGGNADGASAFDSLLLSETEELSNKAVPDSRNSRADFVRKSQLIIASAVAACLTLFLLLFPSDIESDVLRRLLSGIDFKAIVVISILAVGFVLFVVSQFQEYLFKSEVTSTFVDIDERASLSKVEAQISELRFEILQVKAGQDSGAENQREDADSKVELHEFSAIEYYIHRSIKSLDKHIETSEKKASKLLDTGTMYLRRGIYFYVSSILVWQVVAHVWGVDKPLIYGVVSCSLTFLVVEFLAAWFLKQYRSFIDSSIQFMRVRSVFDRYLLSYYAVKEFSVGGVEGNVESKAQVLKVLAEEIKWPEAINSKAGDVNHMVQMFESLAGILEKVKKAPTKNEQA
ncbi:hypothetical protein HF257_10875 [Pseudomonas sp. WS 5106]|uniref:Uncharacterized protein n=1 Tax=Pseudomonas cremoris TaxID=2724178 RepID=A0A7X1DY64_9PSED|nr:hypothetical protein [Pseudomonas cremoris]MBC2381717.1 hypothetical protein [Pseudomonas cremoris]MBC2405872.1 hypothetical protein [Pseudomonas cremoris]MBC2406508.1 hypothetical protein [Pseudomonas cremoris]